MEIILEILKFIVFIIVTYLFMELLTNKKRNISIVGTVLVCCSSCIAFRGVINAILCGQAIILAIDKIMTSDKIVIKVIASAIIGLSAGLYNVCNPVEWSGFEQLLLFVYLAMLIWVVLKNKNMLKITKRTILSAIPCLIIGIALYMLGIRNASCIMIPPEKTETNGLIHLVSYGYSMFLPFVDTGKNIVYSSFLSIFPLSLILAIVYVYKNEKHLEFLLPMILVIVIESIWCMTGLEILGNILKFSGLYMEVCAAAVSLACVYLYIYMIANIEENIFSMRTSVKVVLGLLVLYFLIPRPDVFMTKGYMYVLAMLITLLYFLFINFADKRYQKVLLIVLTIWSVISFIPAIL